MSKSKKQETVRSIDDLFGTDPKFEKDEGIILDYGAFRVTIARAGGANKKFGKLFQVRMKPYKRQMETDTMDEQVAERLMAETYADAVVLKMDVKQEDGSYEVGILRKTGVAEYNRDNVIAAFIEQPEFFKDVQSQANDVSLFRAEQLEGEIKNS